MAPSRRDFLKNSAIAGAALTASSATNLASAQDPQGHLPTPRAMELMALFGLKYPIFQAPHVGAGSDLVAAVSSAGAMGILGGTRLTPEDARRAVATVRAHTQRVFALNYILAFEPASLPMVLEAGAPVLHFSWGFDLEAKVGRHRQSHGLQHSSMQRYARGHGQPSGPAGSRTLPAINGEVAN
jgi:nitronate monooxygenase